MAIKSVRKRDLTSLRLILKGDDAVDWESDETDLDEYRDTLDESHLHFIDGKSPTRWLCNFELKADVAARVKNHMMTGRDTAGKPTLAYGHWSQEVTRHCLRGIEQPADLMPDELIKWRQDKDGLVHPTCMAELERLGVVEEIFGFYARLVLQGVKAQVKNS